MALPFPEIDPAAIRLDFSFEILGATIGPLAIRWYALAYVVGFLLAWGWMRLAHRRGPNPPAREDIDDVISWAVFGVIIGGRLGYCLFYKPAEYLAKPLAILKVWEGGMSWHGGLIGATVAMALFCRGRSIPLLRMGDLACAAAPIGIFLGRLANFINGELWGRPTGLPWGMVFPGADDQPRHPSQLYEAGLEGVALFAILSLLAWRGALMRPGRVGGAFLAGYGIFRILGEFAREPDVQLGFLAYGATMGQLLSLPLVVAGAILYLRAKPVAAVTAFPPEPSADNDDPKPEPDASQQAG